MKRVRLFVLLGLAAAILCADASADESPSSGSWSALGPFLFSREDPAGGHSEGFRPFYIHRTVPPEGTSETIVLYPLFYYRRYGVVYEWSVFKLINRVGRAEEASPEEKAQVPNSEKNFAIWPFYFSAKSPYPGSSYHGIFPLYGDVRDFLGYDRLSWTLFPVYAHTEKKGSVTTYVVWPIFRSTHGRDRGWAVWPLYGHRANARGEDVNFYLWPFGWDNTFPPRPDDPPGTPPTREVGALPFYSSVRRPGYVSVNHPWPFVGYEDRTVPDRYHETRYFWPFIVQGEGDHGHMVDRWGPFYSHSVIKGVDSTWVFWPFWNRKAWTDVKVSETMTRCFYFVYSSTEQRSLSNPNAAPAFKHHLWPIVSSWDNGAGRKQFEVLSPFEPLFADNPEMRETWSPFFAIVRHSQSAPGETQTSLLWNTLAWSRSDNRLSRIGLGPIVTLRRGSEGGWKASWFDFSARN